MVKPIKLTWDDVERQVSKIAKELEGKVVAVYGLPRGGLIPAVILSHRLHVPLLGAPCKDCLVVDDIADSGKTLVHYKESGYTCATLVHKVNRSVVTPHAVGMTTKSRAWIVFPWEV